MLTKLRLLSPILILLFLILQLFILREAKAEYRVFKLGIKYTEKQKKELETLSTLDDQQYVTYYRQTASQQTRIIDHWMCRGRTDQYKRYCTKPIAPAPKPAPQNVARADAPSPQATNQASAPAQSQDSSSQQAPAAQVPVMIQ
jgi:hypothetical protein